MITLLVPHIVGPSVAHQRSATIGILGAISWWVSAFQTVTCDVTPWKPNQIGIDHTCILHLGSRKGTSLVVLRAATRILRNVLWKVGRDIHRKIKVRDTLVTGCTSIPHAARTCLAIRFVFERAT